VGLRFLATKRLCADDLLSNGGLGFAQVGFNLLEDVERDRFRGDPRPHHFSKTAIEIRRIRESILDHEAFVRTVNEAHDKTMAYAPHLFRWHCHQVNNLASAAPHDLAAPLARDATALQLRHSSCERADTCQQQAAKRPLMGTVSRPQAVLPDALENIASAYLRKAGLRRRV
jgi:hypothetical protein